MESTLYGKVASAYAAARPTYPAELFKLLASLCKGHNRVWDVGTGNGQAAVALADYFEEVIATDISMEQLQLAPQRENITYKVTSAGPLSEDEVARMVGKDDSFDLITVATAIHWFDLPTFYAHVQRLLRKPHGIIAIWCYTDLEVEGIDMKLLLEDMRQKSLPFWAPELQYATHGYSTLPFPFKRPVGAQAVQEPSRMETTKVMTASHFLIFLESWSVIQKARENGVELLDPQVKQAVQEAWGSSPSQVRKVIFPISLRVGSPL